MELWLRLLDRSVKQTSA